MKLNFCLLLLSCLILGCTNRIYKKYEAGKSLLENKEYPKAIEQFSIVIQRDESFELAYQYRGKAKMELEKYSSAIQDFDKALVLNGNLAVIYINRSLANIKLKKYEDALIDLDHIIEYFKSDQDTSTIRNVAIAYNNRGLIKHNVFKDTINALIDYNKAIEIDINPKWHLPYVNRGLIYLENENFTLAVEDLNNSIELNPNSSYSYSVRGKIKIYMNDYEGALIDFNEAIKLAPENWTYYNKRGFTYIVLEQYSDAIKDFTKIIAHEPNAYSYNNRGYAKFMTGKTKEALSDCEMSLKLNPADSWVYLNLGLIKYELGEKETACKYFEKASELGREEALQELAAKCK